MPPVSNELKEKMSVDNDKLRTFLKAMISSDPLIKVLHLSRGLHLSARNRRANRKAQNKTKIVIMKNKQWNTDHFTSQQKFQAS